MEVTVKSDLVHITADNGKKVVVNLHTGDLVEPREYKPIPNPFTNGHKASDTLSEVRVSPRVTIHLDDEVEVQLKKGGRKFRSKVRGLRVENDQTYVSVTDPRNGASRTVSVNLVTKPRKKILTAR